MASVENRRNCSEFSEEKEMNIYLKVTKTVAMKVTGSDTIKKLKAAIRDKEGVSENFQELFYGGKCLTNEANLLDCGIQDNSTLHLFLQTSGLVKLRVKISSMQKTIEVHVKRHDTVHKIKLIIQGKEEIQSDTFTLYYAGKVLENGMTLASIGIKDEATLNLVINPRDIVNLSTKLPNGEIVKTEVKIWYTVCYVKEIVGSIFGLTVSDHKLVYGGKQLEDSSTLVSYNITEESIIEMVPVKFQILVKLWSGKTITLYVGQQDKISCVKSKIFEKLGHREYVPSYYLEYAGKRLVDDQDLAKLGVGKQSTLCAKARLSTCVYFTKLHEIKGADKLPGWTTISLLKKFIERRTKLDPVKEVLVEGRALRDNQTMADCGLGKNIELALYF